MTLNEIKAAMKIAKSTEDLSQVDTTPLDGCATANFKPALVSLRCAARFLRWQVIMLNGEVDERELSDLSWVLKNRIKIAA